jgi:hypothetical protein
MRRSKPEETAMAESGTHLDPVDPRAAALLELARVDAAAQWSQARADRAIRAFEVEVALGGDPPLQPSRRSRAHKILLLGLVVAASALAGTALALTESRTSDWVSESTARVLDPTSTGVEVQEAMQRLSELRQLSERGKPERVLDLLSRPPEAGDSLFAREREELAARAECALAREGGQASGSASSQECGRLARQRLLSGGR